MRAYYFLLLKKLDKMDGRRQKPSLVTCPWGRARRQRGVRVCIGACVSQIKAKLVRGCGKGAICSHDTAPSAALIRRASAGPRSGPEEETSARCLLPFFFFSFLGFFCGFRRWKEEGVAPNLRFTSRWSAQDALRALEPNPMPREPHVTFREVHVQPRARTARLFERRCLAFRTGYLARGADDALASLRLRRETKAAILCACTH